MGPTDGTLTLDSTTTLIANSGTGGVAVLGGNIANQGLLDIGAGTVELGGFSSPDIRRAGWCIRQYRHAAGNGRAGSTLVVGTRPDSAMKA